MSFYWPAIIFSVLIHGAALWLLAHEWQQLPQDVLIKPPVYIKATLIDLQSQSKAAAPRQKPNAEKIQPQKKAQDPERLERLKKLAKQKARKDREAKQILEKQKKREEGKLLEQEMLERQAEQERLALEQQRFEENMARELAQLEAEQEAERSARQAENDEQLSKSYSALIRKRIEQNWSRPLSARKNMEATLRIQLIPTGEIIDVALVKSSGNRAFDDSAIRAVKKTRQFDELQDMPTRLFEKDFRRFQLKFKPQDLRQ